MGVPSKPYARAQLLPVLSCECGGLVSLSFSESVSTVQIGWMKDDGGGRIAFMEERCRDNGWQGEGKARKRSPTGCKVWETEVESETGGVIKRNGVGTAGKNLTFQDVLLQGTPTSVGWQDSQLADDVRDAERGEQQCMGLRHGEGYDTAGRMYTRSTTTMARRWSSSTLSRIPELIEETWRWSD